MNVFQAAKQISPADVARGLGLKENHRRFACPFHDDKHTSMACYEDSKLFYCFNCHAKGDATDLLAKVKGLSLRDAAEEICREHGLSHRWESPREVAERKRREDVALLPQAVFQDWRRVMVDLLQEQINAWTNTMAIYNDGQGWVVQHGLIHATRLSDESVRLQSLTPQELEEEIAMRRRGEIPALGVPPVDAEMLLDILSDRLRLTGLRLTNQECAELHRRLGVPGSSAEEATEAVKDC